MAPSAPPLCLWQTSRTCCSEYRISLIFGLPDFMRVKAAWSTLYMGVGIGASRSAFLKTTRGVSKMLLLLNTVGVSCVKGRYLLCCSSPLSVSSIFNLSFGNFTRLVFVMPETCPGVIFSIEKLRALLVDTSFNSLYEAWLRSKFCLKLIGS